jgi:hypothetical protein
VTAAAAVAVRRPREHRDEGSAVVEFVSLGVLMLIPLVYLVMTLGRIQAAAFASDSAARAAARAFSDAPDDATGLARARSAVRLGLGDQGFDVDPAKAMQPTCAASPCLTPGSRISIRVSVDVVLPGIPALIDQFASTHVTVQSIQAATVDLFRPVASGGTG